MAKKKTRYKKHRKKTYVKARSFDMHHLCWQRRYWNKGAVKSLRQFHYCIVRIDRNTLHHHIHSDGHTVPVPSEQSAEKVLRHLRDLERVGYISDLDPIEKRLRLLAALFEGIEPDTSEGFKEQLRIVYKFRPPPMI